MAEYFVAPRGTSSTYIFRVRLRRSACGAPRLQLILGGFFVFDAKFLSTHPPGNTPLSRLCPPLRDSILTCQILVQLRHYKLIKYTMKWRKWKRNGRIYIFFAEYQVKKDKIKRGLRLWLVIKKSRNGKKYIAQFGR